MSNVHDYSIREIHIYLKIFEAYTVAQIFEKFVYIG